MRALIVDDEPAVRLLLSRILARDFDCQAANASNGVEALDLLARGGYDFMLLDLLMPVMNGFETLHAIRHDDTLRDLPVMVMSTVREEARVREAIGLGVGTYVTKPLRPGEVTERLTRFLSRHARPSRPGVHPCADLPAGTGAGALRSHVEAAAVQVFGMQLGRQVDVDADPPPAAVGDEVALVALAMTRPDAEYRLLLRASPDVARVLASMARPHGAVDDVAIASTMQDLAWMLGARLLTSLRGAGEVGELEAPASTRWTHVDPARDGATLAEVDLVSSCGDVRCTVLVRARPCRGVRAARLP
ncbi:hypothetical protein TBR22_A23210 [Luteitalea sp. TBR-22]|uniref:response regulator n=1 Tax=Luteitalea sp. TBR-22 TaxID=2802971 RepID=UPI001AF9BB2E|nr:response regulator [Luteitalea sp. TBR-22]BCS33095.1 hypothetical protein TBR22_A23210 [Luteitalea sp. TBR-22]